MIGREYFEGDRREMIKDMCDLVRNEEHAEDDVGNDDVDTNITEVIQCEEVIQDSSAVIQCEEVTQENSANVQCEEVIQNSSAVIQCEEVIQNSSAVIQCEEVIENKFVDTNVVIEDASKEPLLEVADYNGECEAKRLLSHIKTDTSGCKFYCSKCRFITDTSGHLKQHLLTVKHLNMTDCEVEKITPYECEKCNKKYQSKSGLWKHSEKCQSEVKIVVPIDNMEPEWHKKIDNIEKMMIKFQRIRNVKTKL
jgi:hypothetical protein